MNLLVRAIDSKQSFAPFEIELDEMCTKYAVSFENLNCRRQNRGSAVFV